jgi:hypothetical protein
MTSGKTSPRWLACQLVARSALLGSALLGLAVGASGCGKATDDRPATWTFISTAILEPSCATANCHSALAQRASVDLSTRATGYHSLVDRKFVISQAADPIAPADDRVARSPVIHLMHAEGNLRMPPDMPLPEIDIQLIENWIRAGAAND